MNFSYGVIAAVGILVAISLALISESPNDVIEPRSMPLEKIKTPVCTMEFAPVCGVDGITYGNQCMLDAANVKLDYTGECVASEPEPAPTMEPEPVQESVTTSSMPVAPVTHTIEIAEGSGAPGCEETNECFIPYSLKINIGDTVSWNNIDTAAHTVTSGSMSENGPDGIFDSSLFMSGTTFEFIFDEAGVYPYFCMVHPWMTGEILVSEIEEMTVSESSEPAPTMEPEPAPTMEPEPAPTMEPEPAPTMEPESLPLSVTVSIPPGSAIPGCEETKECYIPYEVKIAVGGTVIWNNDDTAAHTVTGGKMPEGPSGVFDSSMFMAGSAYEFTFDEAGVYPYYCMVHPWMTGNVVVE